MDNKNQTSKEEERYLAATLSFLEDRLETERQNIDDKKGALIAYRREMYDNVTHSAQDYNKLSEAAQYLSPLQVQTMDYEATEQRIRLYEKMHDSPYFARIDFETERWGKETVYIGIGTLEDEDTFDIYVHDWRAPISSVFYRYELGPASYRAPAGLIEGEITLKRQYEIRGGKLNFFFDSGVNIVDDVLKEALSQNASPQMRTIVETIQREQDQVIRDIENDLVIVQGVAGSGKTSIALHRVAFLMYQGLNGRLGAHNIVLISPNKLFAQYISQVLPDLGEENVQTLTFERLFYNVFGESAELRSRNAVLEEILSQEDREKKAFLEQCYRAKTSLAFLELLDKLIEYYERRLIPFSDLYYGGKVIANRELMKARFLQNRELPVQSRLGHIESALSEQLLALRPAHLAALESKLRNSDAHSYDYKTAARLISTKQSSALMAELRKFTRIDYLGLYRHLFTHDTLLRQLAGDFYPQIKEVAAHTRDRLESGALDYADGIAVLYLKLRMDSGNSFADIRQVVVDEAQDYSPVHYEILGRLFPEAKFTVLGDLNQTIVDTGESSLYETIRRVLGKKRNTMVSLCKSFRCSYEIASFASRFADEEMVIERLERHGEEPEIHSAKSEEELYNQLASQLAAWREEGFGAAVICKNAEESKTVQQMLEPLCGAHLVTDSHKAMLTGTVVLPVYLAKGLEFDAVAIWGADATHYRDDEDRRLLYISCTRALHRLRLYHTGKASPLLKAKQGKQ